MSNERYGNVNQNCNQCGGSLGAEKCDYCGVRFVFKPKPVPCNLTDRDAFKEFYLSAQMGIEITNPLVGYYAQYH